MNMGSAKLGGYVFLSIPRKTAHRGSSVRPGVLCLPLQVDAGSPLVAPDAWGLEA